MRPEIYRANFSPIFAPTPLLCYQFPVFIFIIIFEIQKPNKEEKLIRIAFHCELLPRISARRLMLRQLLFLVQVLNDRADLLVHFY